MPPPELKVLELPELPVRLELDPELKLLPLPELNVWLLPPLLPL